MKRFDLSEETDDVYSTDYGWGLFKETDEDSKSSGGSAQRYKRTYAWNERNQLISSVDANYSTSYIYGQDGERTNKYTSQSETLYFNKMWTLHTDSGNAIYGGQSAKNIYLGETRIVTKLNSGENPTYSEEYNKQYFYHSDHLGSASLISDSNGDEYQRIEYTPYGETWVEKTQNTGLEFLPYKFTAKEQDEETGLYYYGARYLDSRYSRWISTDPALGYYVPQAPISDEAKKHNQNLPGMGGVFNHINGNLYHYAGNNPVRYVDPTGMWIDNEDGTYTAEKGDTLWNLYGNEWQEKSGYEGDPIKLQVGNVVGKKRESHDLWESVNSTNTHGISKEQNSNDLAFSVGIGGKCALILGLGAEGGFIIDKSRNLYGYISGSIGCGIQTPSTTKVDLSTLQYLNNSKGISGSISLDPTQKGISSSLTADICLGIVGTYDLNNQKSSGLPNSWSFGSVGGGIWKTGTIVFPIYTNKRK